MGEDCPLSFELGEAEDGDPALRLFNTDVMKVFGLMRAFGESTLELLTKSIFLDERAVGSGGGLLFWTNVLSGLTFGESSLKLLRRGLPPSLLPRRLKEGFLVDSLGGGGDLLEEDDRSDELFFSPPCFGLILSLFEIDMEPSFMIFGESSLKLLLRDACRFIMLGAGGAGGALDCCLLVKNESLFSKVRGDSSLIDLSFEELGFFEVAVGLLLSRYEVFALFGGERPRCFGPSKFLEEGPEEIRLIERGEEVITCTSSATSLDIMSGILRTELIAENIRKKSRYIL